MNSAGADRKGAKEPEVGERKPSEPRTPQNGDNLLFTTADSNSTEPWVKMTFSREYDDTEMWTSSPEKQKNKTHCADMIAKNPQTGAHFSRLDSYKGIIVGEGVIVATEVMLESKVGSGGGDMEQTRWGISAGLTAAKPCILVCKLPEGGCERVRVAAERGRGPPSKVEKV